MKIRHAVLCLAVMVIATLIMGCATGKNEGVKGLVTVGKPYIVRKLILPKQIGREQFLARKVESFEIFTEEDLLPVAAVDAYLEVLAKRGRLPLRVKEGFITKEKGRWYMVTGTLGTNDIVPYLEYYVVDEGSVVCP